ncbi:hypothetical protein LTR62_004821 [Meristemomyces frigidus]|uniref:Heterokaryon incompatibility domain-containing protein n=1 Tax=Meristemomyces frigidus TaxID=1508187 RepID=A0AAN7TDD5_9PEZI|nr:hypothetical protein LTR62_004821 [Meristemomyces frigidus]
MNSMRLEQLSITKSKYTYTPLDPKQKQIRLLDLQPGDPEAPVVCSLRVVSLVDGQDPDYEAVSYAWGDANLREEVQVNGSLLSVPLSTARALSRLRETDQVRTVWIDAICINQQNILERSSQVAFMLRVYRSSRRVAVWLGDPAGSKDETTLSAGDVDTAADTVIHWASAKLGVNTFDELSETLALQKDLQGLYAFNPDDLLTVYAQLESLCQQPWFSRRWVAQEFALGRRNICYIGSGIMNLERALVATVVIGYVAWDSDHLETIRNLIIGITSVASEGEPLATLVGLDANAARMWYATHLPCIVPAGYLLNWIIEKLVYHTGSEPRDIVYATIGIWQSITGLDELPQLLQPDYCLSLWKVFAAAQKHIMRSDRSLFILGTVIDLAPWPKSEGSASWVKRWGARETDNPFIIRACYKANSSRTYEAVEDEREHELWLRGLEVDLVAQHAPTFSPRDLETVSGQCAFINSTRASLNTNVSTKDLDTTAFARTLVADVIWQPLMSDVKLLDDAEVEELLRYVVAPQVAGFTGVPTVPTTDSTISVTARHSYGLKGACGNRSVFRTHDGRFGLGPVTTKPGDVLAVIYGSMLPLMLRPCKNGHELIGPCYLHGMMQGEAIKLHEDGVLQEKTFKLM